MICKHTNKEQDCLNCVGVEKTEQEHGTSTQFHMNQSIDGPLNNWTKRQWEQATSYITKDDGGKLTAEELKAEFVKLKEKGWSCFPTGECSNFCYKKGCLGHVNVSVDSVPSVAEKESV